MWLNRLTRRAKRCWYYRHMGYNWHFCGTAGDQLTSLCLSYKHFISWVILPAWKAQISHPDVCESSGHMAHICALPWGLTHDFCLKGKPLCAHLRTASPGDSDLVYLFCDYLETVRNIKHELFLSNTLNLVLRTGYSNLLSPHLVWLFCKCFSPSPTQKTFVYPKTHCCIPGFIFPSLPVHQLFSD